MRFLLFIIALTASFVWAEPWSDPAPPVVTDPPAEFTAPVAKAFDRLTVHGKPKPLPRGAVTEDWPRFLGPRHDATSRETKLLEKFPAGGPRLMWEVEKGDGYTGPIIAGDRLVFFHRLDRAERVECLHRETGLRYWEHSYPVEYSDRYGYAAGPRGAPVIDEDRVYSLGVTGVLHCLHLPTGQVIWKRDLGTEFRTRDAFFGNGTSPLVMGDRLIISIGGMEGPAVAAFDKATGRMLWGAEREWGASYASPAPGTVGGIERLFVFAGGESRPTHGGLLVLKPETGAITARFPWRADKYESVNASSPVVTDDGVFISQCYGGGGVFLDIAADGSATPRWEAPDVGTHWMNPIVIDGHLYAIAGRHPQDAELVCVEIATGEEKWREQYLWQIEVDGRSTTVGIFRGSLLAVDDRVLCLGEFGALLWMKLTPEGGEILSRCQPMLAQETWTLPNVSHGLLYLAQHQKDQLTGKGPRWLCYDLRGE